MGKPIHCRLDFEHEFQAGERKFLVAKHAHISNKQLALNEVAVFKPITIVVPVPSEPGKWYFGDVRRVQEGKDIESMRPHGADVVSAMMFHPHSLCDGVYWPAFPPKELQVEIINNGTVSKNFKFYIDGWALLCR